MVAVAQLMTSPAEEGPALIHVRFLPSGEIFSIDGCPQHLSPESWFLHLRAAASDHYRVLAGGRGFFRIPRDRFETILGQAAKAA